MYCRNCGEKVPNMSKYCCSCGKRVQHEFESINKIKGLLKRYKNAFISLMKSKGFLKYATILMPVTAVALIVFTLIIPAYSNLKLNQGKRYLLEKNYEKAAQAFSHAEISGAKDKETYAYMGEAYLQNNDYENAEKALKNAVKFDNSPEALKLLAEVFEYEGNDTQLEETLRQLITVMPNDPEAYVKLAKIYAEEKRYENAALILESLLKIQDNSEASALLYNIYAQSYLNNKSLEKSKPVEEKANEAMKSISVEDLSVYEGTAINVSPAGKYLLTKTYDKNNPVINIFERKEGTYIKTGSFKPPLNYDLSFDNTVFSENEEKIAFYNGEAEPYVSDSYIYVYDIAEDKLFSISDPKETYSLFLSPDGIFVVDSIPSFSQNGEKLYFGRYSSKATGLYQYDFTNGSLSNLYEPAPGGKIAYKIIERNGKIYFSVSDQNNRAEGGLFVYENGDVKKLKFEYDKMFYDLALWDMSKDGRYLMYFITISSQNSSFYFHVLDLDKMALTSLYPQDIETVGGEFVSVNYYDVLGSLNTYICKNAGFSTDGKNILIAEINTYTNRKIIREISIETGNNYFSKIIENNLNVKNFSLGYGNEKNANSGFKQLQTGELLLYDEGLKLIK